MEIQDFHHPFTPYDIQLQFMRALYGCLEDGKVGVFESPTGTIHLKLLLLFISFLSLSFLCSNLTPPQAP